MKVKSFRWLLLAIALLTISSILTGCASSEKDSFNDNELDLNKSSDDILKNNSPLPSENGTDEEIPLGSREETSGSCQDAWVCISSKARMHRLSNCTFKQKESCETRCEDGQCLENIRSNVTCIPGFKCKSSNSKGYQMESCGWTSETRCEFGCSNNTCNTQPSESATAGEENKETKPAEPIYYLSLGETQTITYNEVKYSFSIYNLDAGQVRVSLDNFKSDWITEGSSTTFGVGVKITVKEIYYQAYPGGKQMIGYTVG